MTEVEASLAKVIAAYKAAVAARDIEAFIRLYDPAVRVFDTWGVWSYEGAAAWQVAIEGWFAAHPNDKFKVTFDDVRSVLKTSGHVPRIIHEHTSAPAGYEDGKVMLQRPAKA